MDTELLYKFFRGEADEEEMEMVRQWDIASEENHRQLLEERRVFDMLVLMGRGSLSESRLTLNDEESSSSGRSILNPHRILRMAAGIIVLIGLTVFLTYYIMDSGNPVILSAYTPTGQRAEVVLPDCTHVWINGGTVLRYPSRFSGKTREVTVEGEGFFNVSKDKNHPFIVSSPYGRVTVTGTEFNLKSYPSSKHFEVSLLEGGVRAQAVGDDKEYVLKPGDKLDWVDGKTNYSTMDEYDLSWRDGIISFQGKTVIEVLTILSNAFGKDIHVSPGFKTNDGEKLTGKFRQSDGLVYALQILSKNYGFSFSVDADTGEITVR